MLITPIDKYFYFIAVCILDVEDVEASQSTVILEEEEEEDRAAIVNMDSIHRVVSMSQHFSATPLSQQSGQNPLPTCSNQVGISPSPNNNQVGISPPPTHTQQSGEILNPHLRTLNHSPPLPPQRPPLNSQQSGGLTAIRWELHTPLPPFNSQSGKKNPSNSQQSGENLPPFPLTAIRWEL